MKTNVQMIPYLALFRGVNVGGKGRLPMEGLRRLLADLGAVEISTYINSGNVVFGSAEPDPAVLAEQIAAAVEREYAFRPGVQVLSASELRSAVVGNPYAVYPENETTVHLGFLTGKPAHPDLARLESLRSGREEFSLADRVIYLYAPDGVGRSKLAAGMEKALGVPLTDRNWRTVTTLLGKMDALIACDYSS